MHPRLWMQASLWTQGSTHSHALDRSYNRDPDVAQAVAQVLEVLALPSTFAVQRSHLLEVGTGYSFSLESIGSVQVLNRWLTGEGGGAPGDYNCPNIRVRRGL